MKQFNETQLAILEALGRFQYMTTTQMMTWGVTRNQRHLYEVLKSLEGKPSSPAVKMNFGVIAGVGKLHSIYHLSKYGVEVLHDAGIVDIKHPKKTVIFTRDYFHRIATVDAHQVFELWAQKNHGEVSRFDTYYDRTGKSLRGFPAPKTTIIWNDNQLTPDAVCEVVGNDELTRLCAIEIHRGRDMLRLDKQILQYVEAIKAEAIENFYGYDKAARILLLFDDEKAISTCLNRFKNLDIEAQYLHRFFLNTCENIASDLMNGWQNYAGEQTKLW